MAASLFAYFVVTPAFFSSIASKQLSIGEGAALLSIAVVYGWWAIALTSAGSGVRGASLAVAVLAALWALFAQGLAGLAFCAVPFCPDFAPWSDVGRYGSLIAGALATWTSWRAYRTTSGPTQWAAPVTAVVLTAISWTLQGIYGRF